MKKSILVFSAVLMTISALGFIKWNQTNDHLIESKCAVSDEKSEAPPNLFLPKPANLYYDLGSRFKPMKKSAIASNTSVEDFLNLDYNKPIKVVEDVNLIVIKDNKHSKIQFSSFGSKLSKDQINFLSSCAYSTNLKIQSNCMVTNRKGQNAEWLKCIEHFSVVPEQQAKYSLGNRAFIEYLQQANKKNCYNLDLDKLGFAKLTFIVNEDGNVSNFNLDRSCGYEKIDKAITDLLQNAPGEWIPAINEAGETVAQELVISFGKGGC